MIEIMELGNAAGRLQISVLDISIAAPVVGALVNVRNIAEDEVQDTNIDLVTDESGKTEEITLPAPPVAFSQEPNRPKPYREYNVTVSAEGFDEAVINGVQIFPDMLALQRVNLVPTSIAVGEEEINIPPPKLWGDYPPKIPEEEVKPLPAETGFVVLDQVVIPEYVVVHDGRPEDDTAQNYYVPFKDYIKNVASSEIYTTWPDAAIRANVLAIISFTLNRVFTEWYRSRGKNFTITSSTAFDHFYVPGRTIYEEISNVVDEMFTTYIKRFGSDQPLFAQYCDGDRVSCPGWMTQWGAKDLADQGYDTMQILRHYYGDDIYLENAVKVSGIPSSFPGENLQEGSTGADVRTIQNQLNTISNSYSAIPKVRVDGVFGEQTTKAVIAFQEIFNMPATGIVDFPTWYEISQIYVAVARLAEL